MSRTRLRQMGPQGFSLVELMVTLAIVTLVAGIAASGMPVVVDAYARVTDSANAQAVLTGASVVLRQRLSVATEVSYEADEVDDADEDAPEEMAEDVDESAGAAFGRKVASFVDGTTGYTVFLRQDDSKGIVEAHAVQDATGEVQAPSASDSSLWEPVVTGIESQNSGWELVVGYDELRYSEERHAFRVDGLKVCRRSQDGSGSTGGIATRGWDNPLVELETPLYVRQLDMR